MYPAYRMTIIKVWENKGINPMVKFLFISLLIVKIFKRDNKSFLSHALE